MTDQVSIDDVFSQLQSDGVYLDFIINDTPEALLRNLKKIRLPMRIVTIYPVGSKHIAWIQTTEKIRKV